jgi:hypothetical protein
LNPGAAALDTAPKNKNIGEREREKLLVGSSVVCKQSRESEKLVDCKNPKHVEK